MYISYDTIYKPLGSAQPYSIQIFLHLRHQNTDFMKKGTIVETQGFTGSSVIQNW